MTSEPVQNVPAQAVAFPSSVSPAARRSLAFWAERPKGDNPALDDAAGWRARSENSNKAVMQLMQDRLQAMRDRVSSQAVQLNGVTCYQIEPKSPASQTRILFDIHGGAFNSGGGASCEAFGIVTASAYDALVYAVDYRMPPDHPYPAALDDCVAVYRALLERHDPAAIVVRGTSAGGNLAAALILRARGEGLPLPAASLLLTPELDLTESGDSFQTNAHFDVVLKGSLMQANLLYAGGHDLADPLLSPLFGDLAAGFPPTLLTVGTRDLFLSNAARMHNALRRSGNYSELIVEEAMPHGGFFGAPEDDALLADAVDFAARAWSGSLPSRRLAR